MSWLDRVTRRLAAETDLDATELGISSADAREILDIARVASHASGQRTNAPLLCYVLGIAHARGVPLERLGAAARAAAEDAGEDLEGAQT